MTSIPKLDALAAAIADHDILEVAMVNKDFSEVFSIPTRMI